jgi:hypothetical protein
VRFTGQNQANFDEQRAIAAEQRPFKEPALSKREVLPFEKRVTGSK